MEWEDIKQFTGGSFEFCTLSTIEVISYLKHNIVLKEQAIALMRDENKNARGSSSE
jgi:hypothetical protein